MGREHGTIEGRLSVLMIALPLLTRRPDNYSQSDKDGGNCGKDSQSDQRHPSAVIASITLSYAWPNLDIERLCERPSSRKLRESRRATNARQIFIEAKILFPVVHRSTGRSSSFFEECLYRFRYNSASSITLCMRASAMASRSARYRRPNVASILLNRLSDAFDLFEPE